MGEKTEGTTTTGTMMEVLETLEMAAMAATLVTEEILVILPMPEEMPMGIPKHPLVRRHYSKPPVLSEFFQRWIPV